MSLQSARSSVVRRLAACALAVGLGVASGSPAFAQESALAQAKAQPTSFDASFALGRALRRAGRGPEAVIELRRAASMLPGRSGDGAIKVQWELARTFIAQRDFGQAMIACRVAGAQTGGATAGHACTAEAHLLWRRATEALNETSAALAGGTKSYEAKVAEARAYLLQLKEPEAEKALREAITWRDDAPDAHLWLGKVLVDGGKTDAGIAELRRAVALDGTDPESAYELARALGTGAEAQVLLQRAVKDRPTYTEAWIKLAEIELGAGRPADARKSATVALASAPQDPNAHVLVGRVAYAEGKYDDAINEAKAALGILGNLAAAKLLTADALAAKGEIDLALEQYQSAWAFDRTDPTPLLHAADACRRAGRFTSARAYGDRVTKDFPDLAPGWVAYGEALLADKDVAGAKAAFDKALAAPKGPIDKDAVRAKIAGLK
jgi:tetratricopeptide (TPR) repeat protein